VKIESQISNLCSMKHLQLEKNERRLLEEGASHFVNEVAVGGTLTLTNQRLVFHTNARAVKQHELSIVLESIADVCFFKTLFLNPNGLSLVMSNGTNENFIVDDKKHWCAKIKEQLAVATA
jgi:hypothetical protein